MDNIEIVLKKWLAPISDKLNPLYLVGGIVRDIILDRPSKDIDLMCQGAEIVARKLARSRKAAVIPFEKKADEPCFRIVDREHRDFFIDIAEMRGDSVIEDMTRRDLTMNAIAIQIEDGGKLGDVIDPLNGRRDLKSRKIRIAGPNAFVSDPLRILRAVRFAAETGFTIEEATLEAMRLSAGLIKNVSAERITAELIRIFSAPHTAHFVRMMDELKILEVIFPEILAMKGCTQNSYHHLDVWNHSLLVLENCESILNKAQDLYGHVSERIQTNLSVHNRIAILKLTALLHDVGKPLTRSVKEDTGRVTFYDHDNQGSALIFEIASRLKMSSRDREFMKNLILEHLHILNVSRPGVKSFTRMKLIRKMMDDCIPLFILGLADTRSILGPDSSDEERTRYYEWSKKMIIAYYEEIKERMERRPLINGTDLIAMGITPGPEMGKILGQIREAQDSGLIKDRDEAMTLARACLEK